MFTKEDFKEAIKNEFLKRDLTANLYHAGDPRILQTLEAQATMLSMLSQQIEVAMQEPFVKSRDATVLADAALKGLIFTAEPCIVKVKVTNNAKNIVHIASGRGVIDSVGRFYVTLEPVNIAGEETAYLRCQQLQTETQTHTVNDSYPFYKVEVANPTDGSYISTLSVKVNGELFTPSYKFNGINKNDKVFHVDSDEFQQLSVKFGAQDVLGTQPQDGDVILIEKGLTFGDILPELESPFSLQYIFADDENNLKLEMAEMLKAGTAPVNIATLRELVRYPSIYDENAVFLGEFDMLLRAKFSNLAFLNVWNEAREEQVRGPNVDNINTLFVSFELPLGSALTRSAVEAQIKSVILNADDSYKIKFVTPVVEKIQINVSGNIARIYDSEQVTAQIKDVLITEYGQNSFSTKQGKVIVKNKEISDLLRQKVAAIADSRGDFDVTVGALRNGAPEVFRYADNASITVNLSFDNYENNVWGGGYSNR